MLRSHHRPMLPRAQRQTPNGQMIKMHVSYSRRTANLRLTHMLNPRDALDNESSKARS